MARLKVRSVRCLPRRSLARRLVLSAVNSKNSAGDSGLYNASEWSQMRGSARCAGSLKDERAGANESKRPYKIRSIRGQTIFCRGKSLPAVAGAGCDSLNCRQVTTPATTAVSISKDKSAGRIFTSRRPLLNGISFLPVNHDAAASDILGIRVVNVFGRTQHIVIYHREGSLVPYFHSELIDAAAAVDLAVSRGQ
jgi:hypothetical protein